MDKRKRIIRLRNDMEKHIAQESLPVSPETFLFNKYYLALHKLRSSKSALTGIDKKAFSSIGKRFSERIKNDFINTLSLSFLASLPREDVITYPAPLSDRKQKILFLTDKVVLPANHEKDHDLYFSYLTTPPGTPFSNVKYYPFSEDKLISTSIQSTIFDAIREHRYQVKLTPCFFDTIFFEDYTDATPEIDTVVLQNIRTLLKKNGTACLVTRRNFISSNTTKKVKEQLYRMFTLTDVLMMDNVSVLVLRKNGNQSNDTVTFRDTEEKSTVYVPSAFLTANNLLTFREDITEDRFNIIQKIRERSEQTAGDLFNFSLGMFPAVKQRPHIDTLRKNNHYKPLIRSRDIEPFAQPQNTRWILLEKENFFTMPSKDLFSKKKILLRYLSVNPIFALDTAGLYFMSDVAAITPKSDKIDLGYALAYFNSNVIRFYYDHMFPHHNKFLKKNFRTIPFVLPGKNIQNIIRECVSELESAQTSLPIHITGSNRSHRSVREKLDGYIYQLFKITPSEQDVIETYLS